MPMTAARGKGHFVARQARTPDRAETFSLAILLLFSLGIALLALPAMTPRPPYTQVPFTSVPMALLAVAFMHRPTREHPVYGAIYALLRVALAPDGQWPFIVSLATIEIAQTVAHVWLLWRFYPRFGEPFWASIWPFAVLALTAAGALFIVEASQLSPESAAAYAPELTTMPWIAWRHIWLGNAVAYLGLAGPIAILIGFRRRFLEAIWRRRDERRVFLGLAWALLIVSALCYPLFDISGLALTPDIRLSLSLFPAPIALAMAARFRVNGSSAAMLILAPMMILSVCGPYSAVNWNRLPITTTPAHALILMMTTATMVLAVISRQLRLAVIAAEQASEARSRFIAMLNHELRTPLNAILGFTELMRLKQLRELGEAVGPIENIHASGQRLLAMIEGLLGHADRGAGAFEIHRVRVDPVDIARDVVAELHDQFHHHRVGVELNCADRFEIDADPRALRQMLTVLVAYPLRLVGPDTHVRITAERLGTDTVVEVVSTGLIGAIADDRDKIEMQLVAALALAQGGRLQVPLQSSDQRAARLTFFATHAAG